MERRDFDVVIVGSGAGGGTIARELAPLCAEGLRIAVLEWGRRVTPEMCTGHEVEMARRLYVDSGGVMTQDRSMTLAYGRAYGGSTVVYTGTSLRIPAEVVDGWDVPGLEWSDIDARCAKHADANNVHLLEEHLINDNNRLFRDGCDRLGWRVRQFPVNIKGCRGSGLCNLGCPNGAKQGTNMVQLPEAERLGVEVVTGCRVEKVGEGAVEAVVEAIDDGSPSEWAPGRYRIAARHIVLCAGAVNSPALLLRSGFGDRLPMLGRYLTLHPALILVGEHEHPLSNFHGHPKAYYCDHFLKSHGFLLETCMYFPFVTAKNLIGFGAEHSALMRAFPRLQMILVLAIDPARESNRVTINRDGNPVVQYKLSDDVLASIHESMKVSARVFFAAGARRVHVPAAENFFIDASEAERIDDLVPRRNVRPGGLSITSAHLMGGCRMGGEPSSSVTNAWGEVHGVDGLHVADASLFPRCSEVNPYLTVMALADRVAENLKRKLAEENA